MGKINIELFQQDFFNVDSGGDFSSIEKMYNCTIFCSTEKHSSLQYTYYYEIDFGGNENFFIEVEDGISNGTQVNNAEWGSSTKEMTRQVEVLDDVIFNELAFNNYCEVMGVADVQRIHSLKRKAIIIFENNKLLILDNYRRQSYDNYATGGGTIKTDGFYKAESDKLANRGVFWKEIYKVKEVDRNFI